MSTVIEWQRGMCVAKAQLVPQSTAYNPDNVLAKTFAHYQQCLHHSKKAHDYLQTRGLFDKTLLQALGVGFCDRSLHRLLPSARTVAGQRVRGELRQLGLMRPSGRETFEGAIVVPAHCNGQYLAAYGRRITPKLSSRCVYYIRWTTEEAGLFNEAALLRHRHIYVCKSPIEVLTLIKAGITNVVGLWGDGVATPWQCQQLECSKLLSITLLMDRGPEADAALTLLAKFTTGVPVMLRYCWLPNACDINHVWQKSGGNAQILKSLLVSSEVYSEVRHHD